MGHGGHQGGMQWQRARCQGALTCPCLGLRSLGNRDLSFSGDVALQDNNTTLQDIGGAKGAWLAASPLLTWQLVAWMVSWFWPG